MLKVRGYYTIVQHALLYYGGQIWQPCFCAAYRRLSGGTVHLTCPPDGYAILHVQWSANGTPLEAFDTSGSFNVSLTSSQTGVERLTLSNLSLGANGSVIQCSVSFANGYTSRYEFLLIVMGESYNYIICCFTVERPI